MDKRVQELKDRLTEVNDLRSSEALLSWDQNTYMPPGGAAARGRQMATLGRLAHEKFTDPAIGRLLDDLKAHEQSLPYDSFEASLIRVTRRDYERATKVPSSFVATMTEHASATFQVWSEARPANDFARVRPHLEKMLELSRTLADFFPGYEHIADPLIDFADFGMRASTIKRIFGNLRDELVPIVREVAQKPPADDSCLRTHFPEGAQWAFGMDVIRRFGYDLTRGRQDKSPHPFTTGFSIGDVRITTRVNEHHLTEALFGTMHEAGHALYEQGVDPSFEATPLATGTSSGVHESQSRLWENLVGRSREFWKYFYPRLKEVFPDQLRNVAFETFYRAINKVSPSLIRVEADEVTYNLHVMLRFDFEMQLLEGSLSVRELPEAWRERYRSDLGVAPLDDRDGVMQDIHWYFGQIGGMFQGYTLGNIMASQFFEAALGAHPEIREEMAQGKFETLHRWLTENIYRHGSVYTAEELVSRVTGKELTIAPYIKYLKTKFGELYGF